MTTSVMTDRDSQLESGPNNTRLGHYYCRSCYPNLLPGIKARCGAALLGIAGRYPDQCVVCLDLSFYDCTKCGAS